MAKRKHTKELIIAFKTLCDNSTSQSSREYCAFGAAIAHQAGLLDRKNFKQTVRSPLFGEIAAAFHEMLENDWIMKIHDDQQTREARYYDYKDLIATIYGMFTTVMDEMRRLFSLKPWPLGDHWFRLTTKGEDMIESFAGTQQKDTDVERPLIMNSISTEELDFLNKMIAEGESETLEFKKSTGQLRQAFTTICGFLNNKGGRILFGVTNKGKIIGQTVSGKTLEDIASHINKVESTVQVRSKRLLLDEETKKEVIMLTVDSPTDSQRPFIYDGRPYQRIANTTSIMPFDLFEKLILQRSHSHELWENKPAKGVTLEDLDHDEILKTIRVAIDAGRLSESSAQDTVSGILDRLGLRQNDELLQAAVVLFGKKFLPYYPQCELRMARFKSTTKTEFLDSPQVRGNAFKLLEEAMLFLQRHNPVAARVKPDRIVREDKPLFPLEALREAVVNALCHRDYSQPGGSIRIAMYDDRLEIWNDGQLLPGLMLKDLKRDHPSKLRNPLIADVFHRRGLIEKWGRGTQRIVELCVQAGHPEPLYAEQSGTFGVKFFSSRYIAPQRVESTLSTRQREILQIFATDTELAFRNIRSQLDEEIAERTLRDDLIHLKRLGLIDTKGHGRGAVWFLKPAP